MVYDATPTNPGTSRITSIIDNQGNGNYREVSMVIKDIGIPEYHLSHFHSPNVLSNGGTFTITVNFNDTADQTRRIQLFEIDAESIDQTVSVLSADASTSLSLSGRPTLTNPYQLEIGTVAVYDTASGVSITSSPAGYEVLLDSFVNLDTQIQTVASVTSTNVTRTLTWAHSASTYGSAAIVTTLVLPKLGFIDNDGIDLGNKYVNKDYLNSRYPDLDPEYTVGERWGWGHNGGNDTGFGQIGDGTTISKSSPVRVAGGSYNWKVISAGASRIGGIKSDGTLWMNGQGNNGAIGNNSTLNQSSPVTVAGGGTNWRSLTVGAGQTHAIKTDGTLWSWGNNGSGQLGNNSTANQSSPVSVVGGFTDWASVACSYNYTLAIKTNGSLWSWGNNGGNGYRTLLPSNASSPVSVTVGGITNWKQVSCAYAHAGGITQSGVLWMWGSEQYGRLGNNIGTSSTKTSPVTTAGGGTNWKQLSCGYQHNAAVKTDGTLWTWGRNYLKFQGTPEPGGQLGDGTTIDRSSPVQVANGGTDWKMVSCGDWHVLALKTDGSLWAWGGNVNADPVITAPGGQLGDGTTQNRSVPTRIGTDFNWRSISASDDAGSAALKE